MVVAAFPANPAERLAGLIEALCKAVAAHGARGLLTVPLLLLLWSRLSRMAGRARRLAKRLAAGDPLAAPARPRAAPRATPSRPYARLPRGVTWLVRAVPGTAAGAAALQFLLDDPAMAAVAHLPPMRRLLRPLCRMLGVKPPIKPPASPQVAAPTPIADEAPRPSSGRLRCSSPPLDPPAPPIPTISTNVA
jgi:hypothetical protein